MASATAARLLYPCLVVVGTGSTDYRNGSYTGSNAVWVIGDFGTRPANPEWVASPPNGYVPYSLVYPRWSFSYPNADFSAASVTLTHQDGTQIPVTLEQLDNRFIGDRTLVWVPSVTLGVKPAQDTRYTVTIRNVLVNSVSRDFEYDVVVIDPDSTGTSPTFTPTATPSPTPSPSPSPTASASPSPTPSALILI